MKPRLTVTGRYVDLDFGTVTPIKLSQQFAQESIAESAARAIAVSINIEEFSIYSAKEGSTKTVRLQTASRADATKKRRARVRRRNARHAKHPL